MGGGSPRLLAGSGFNTRESVHRGLTLQMKHRKGVLSIQAVCCNARDIMRLSSKCFVLAKMSTLAVSSATNFRGDIPPLCLKVHI